MADIMNGVGDWLERTKNTTIENVKEVPGVFQESGIVGGVKRGVTNALVNDFVAGPAEKLAMPYSKLVSRPLSAGLQAIKDAKNPADLRNAWNTGWERSSYISPGQALVGAIGRYVPGQQQADKINWADSLQVNGYFSKEGSLQKKISGGSDFLFNVFLDPLMFAGKTLKVAKLAATGTRRTVINLPFGAKINQIGKLSNELELARDVNMKSGASVTVDSILKFADDPAKMQLLPIVARSQDSLTLSRILSNAAKVGGRNSVIDVLQVGIGDINKYDDIAAKVPELANQIDLLRSSKQAIHEDIAKVNKKLERYDTPRLTPAQLRAKEKANADLLKAQEELKAVRKELKTSRSELSVVQDVAGESIVPQIQEQAFSRFAFYEHLRRVGAEVSARGMYVDINPIDNALEAKALSKLYGYGSRAIRTVGYLTPTYKPREVPAGSVTIAGKSVRESGDEFRARLLQAAPVARLTVEEQKNYYNGYIKLATDSQRFQYLDDFETQVLQRMILKKFVRDPKDKKVIAEVQKMRDAGRQEPEIQRYLNGNMDTEQFKTISAAIQKMADDMRVNKVNHLKRIINEQNYVHVDDVTGDTIILKELQDKVDDLAKKIAADNKLDYISNPDKFRKQAVDLLTNTPLYRTQVPNVHFGVDFSLLDKIMTDDKTLVSSLVSHVRNNPDATSTSVVKLLDDAKKIAPGFAQGLKEAGRKSWDYQITQVYNDFQNYIWKPSVLLSLRYSSRNVFEGWGRVLSSISDMTSHYGYSATALAKGFFSPSAITEPIRSATNRITSRIEREGLIGTGGTKSKFDAVKASKFENELEIGRTFGITNDDGLVIVEKIQQRFREEGDYFLEQAKDVLAASFEVTMRTTGFFKTYRGANKLVADEISKISDGIFNVTKKGTVSEPLLNALRSGDYQLAYNISIQSDPQLVKKTLSMISTRANSARKKIAKASSGVNLKKNPIFADNLRRADEMFELLSSNAQATLGAFDTRIKIIGDWKNALSKTTVAPQKGFAYSRKPIKIARGVTIDAPYLNNIERSSMSSANSTSREVLGSRRSTFGNFFNTGNRQSLITTTDAAEWTGAHAEYVNHIIYGDDAAKIVVDLSVTQRNKADKVIAKEVENMKKAGKSQKEIKDYLNGKYSNAEIKEHLLNWINSPASDAWRAEKRIDLNSYRDKFSSAEWNDITETIFADVEKYLPMRGPNNEDLSFLRTALNEGKFTEIQSGLIPNEFRSAVYGNVQQTGTGFGIFYRNLIGNLFHALATMPEDTLVRHPFYNAVYRAEGNRMANSIARQGKKPGDYTKQIEQSAARAAHKAVIDRLYTVERHTNIGGVLKFMSPFYMAQQNSAKYWLNTAIRNPDVAVRIVEAYTTPYRIGTVKNRDEYYANTNQIATPWNIKGHVMLMDYPQWMTDKFFAGDSSMKAEIPLSGFDVMFQGQPIGVPQLGSPIASLALGTVSRFIAGKEYGTTKFMDAFGITLEDAIGYVQPFYDSTKGEGVTGTVTSAFGGGSVALQAAMTAIGGMSGSFDSTSTGTKFANRVNVIQTDKLVKMAESNTPITGAVIEDIRNKSIALAINSFWLEAIANGMPTIASSRFRTSTDLTLKPELQRSIQQNGYDLGTAMFTDKLNITQGEYVVKLLTDSQTDNRFAFNSTDKTLSGIYSNQNLIEQADKMTSDKSLIGVFFNQGDWNAEYSPVVADTMYSITINGKPIKYSAQDRMTAAEDLQVRSGNREYYAGVEKIENAARAAGIQKGTVAYDKTYGEAKKQLEFKVADTYPLWGARDVTSRQNRVDKNVALVQEMLSNSNYMNTVGKNIPTVTAMQEYVKARGKLMAELEVAKEASGRKTVDARANAYVGEALDLVVSELDRMYPGFRRVHDIYFNGDKLGDVSVYTSGYGY